jgi:hypothetical protein
LEGQRRFVFCKKKLDGGPDEATVAAAHKEAEDALEPKCSEYDGSEEYCVFTVLFGVVLLAATYFLKPKFLALLSFLWNLFRRST